MKVKVIKTKNKKCARIGSAAARAPGSHGTLSLSCMRMFDWQRGWDDEGSRRCTVIQHTYLHSDEIYGEKNERRCRLSLSKRIKNTSTARRRGRRTPHCGHATASIRVPFQIRRAKHKSSDWPAPFIEEEARAIRAVLHQILMFETRSESNCKIIRGCSNCSNLLFFVFMYFPSPARHVAARADAN